MKKIRIMQAAIAIVIMTTLASCAASYYPYGPSDSLVISSAPGVYTYRYPDGRYYYRNPQGYLYWRGYDNRYYLDRSYIGKVHYDRREYNEWSRHYNSYNNRNGYHH